VPASSAARVARRWLYLTHRWIGIASCLLFAMWFLSGLVMVYVPYPSLPPAERLARAEPIDWTAVDVPPPLDAGRMPRALSLEMRDGVPVWRVGGWDGRDTTISAVRGAVIPPVDAALARRVASRFSRTPVTSVERLERDQWTVAGGFDRHRPLWKVVIADSAGTELYVSATTGSVVQRTTRHERFWNWLGSVPHWLYPTVLRQDNAAWRQVVLWVSGPCIAAAVAGMWIGILRTRLGARRFKGGRVTPYHGWLLWHHVAGMVGGVFLIAWIFSGWLSVDPGHVFRAADRDEAAVRAYSGGVMPTIALPGLRRVAAGAAEVRFTDHAGVPLLTVSYPDGRRQVLDPTTLSPARPPQSAILAAARKLMGGAPIVAVERLTTPDAYWYEPGALPALPVLRVRFDDPARTWLMIDPATGDVLATLDRRRRVYRWAFDLLHTWDLNALTLHRPAWDILLWLLSALGLVTSVSGLWLGYKRLVR